MPLNCGCCCCSSRDTESVSDKSWTAGAVNKSFENVEKTQPKTATTQSTTNDGTSTDTLGRKSVDSEDGGVTVSKIDLNLNIFENDRFSDMAATIHKSQMCLDKI